MMRCVKPVPKTEKWMCAGRHALMWFFHGYGPGLIVVKKYSPLSFVTVRPAPVKFGSRGAGCWSRWWM